MQEGDRYVVNSQNTLYYLPSASCAEGASINLSNTQVVRVYNIDGRFVKGDYYTTGNYNNTSYICHIWQPTDKYNDNYLILPAVIIVLSLFYVIFSWFKRLRG